MHHYLFRYGATVLEAMGSVQDMLDTLCFFVLYPGKNKTNEDADISVSQTAQ